MNRSALTLAVALTTLVTVVHAKQHVRAATKSPARITPALLRGKIIYRPVTPPKKTYDLWCVGIDGKGDRRFWSVPAHAFASIDEIAVSPDASRVAFAAVAPGNELNKGSSVWLSDLSGRHRRVICEGGNSIQGGLAWSPNGKSLLWASSTGQHSGGPMTAYASVCVVKADGTGLKSFGQDDYFSNASWDRQGRRIRYSSIKGGRSESPEDTSQQSELRSANADGSEDRLSIGEDAAYQYDSLSPDGNHFVSAVGPALALRNTDGTAARELLSDRNSKMLSARFTANGKSVVFVALRGGRFQGMHINIDGSGLRPIGPGHPAGQFVQWLP